MKREYKSQRKPREKQAEAMRKSKGKKAFAFLMAMRTGKTKVVCDEFGILEAAGKIDDLCIIAPAGVYETWAKEGEDPSGIYADFSDDLRKRMKVHIWRSGTYKSAKRQQELSEFLAHHGPRVLIVNVEATSTVEDLRLVLLAFVKGRRVYGVVDESTVIKNASSKRAKFINRKLAKLFDVRRILSGLITPRSPLDLYGQFEFLDTSILGYNNFYAFRARFAIMKQMDFGGRMVPIVVGYRDVEQLQKLIAPYSFRVRLEDCYDLPPSVYTIRDVPLTVEQRRIYDELKTFSTAQLGKERHVTATIVISKLLRLHQVLCGHTVDTETGVFETIPEKRTAELISLLEEYDGKAIIWCSYDHDVRKVSEALAAAFKVKVARFWGGNQATREEEEKMFKTQKDCPYMVATPDAGKFGRTWDMANLVVYYSSTNDLEKRSQSEERPKGVDKTFPIQYVDLIARGTVEEKIIQAIRAKIDIATIINGDNYREWLI